MNKRRDLGDAGQVTAASQPICDLISRYKVSAERIPLGIDFQAWPARKPQPRNQDRPIRLLHVANLNLIKDQTTLLQALSQLAEFKLAFHLDIVEEDVLSGRIQATVRELHLEESVSFHGHLNQEHLRPIFEVADLLILSSRHEAGPLVLLEAAAVGVPTVGTAVGHLAEWHPAAAIAVPSYEGPKFSRLANPGVLGLISRSQSLRLANISWLPPISASVAAV